MNFSIENATYILSHLAHNPDVKYDHGHMSYSVDFDILKHYHNLFYDEKEYTNFIMTMLYICEINLWNIHNITILVNNDKLEYYMNNQQISIDNIISIHVEDKRQIELHIIQKINELNAKGKKVANVVYNFNDTVETNKARIQDINNLKEMNNNFLGKLNLFKLKQTSEFNFASEVQTPNRPKELLDLYDVLKVIKTGEANYKEIIFNYFNNIKTNMEKGLTYMFDYNKFQGSFTSQDLFLLNKVIFILDTLLNDVDNVTSSNKLLIDKQTAEIKHVMDMLEHGGYLELINNIKTVEITDIRYYPYKDLNINLIMPDNALKAIIRMYSNIKYSE